MKIKISEKAVTFKITEEELKLLLVDQYLEKTVRIGPNLFGMAIDLRGLEYPDESAGHSIMLVSDSLETRLLARTTREEIQKLADMGKDRDGISIKTGDLDIVLQVDMRNDTRPRRT